MLTIEETCMEISDLRTSKLEPKMASTLLNSSASLGFLNSTLDTDQETTPHPKKSQAK
jgi:hypothetical protein